MPGTQLHWLFDPLLAASILFHFVRGAGGQIFALVLPQPAMTH